jgi:hypothetical protein
MTAAGLSMRRPRPWTRSDLEGGVPGARRQAGSRRRAVGWIQNVRQQAEEPRRSDDGGDGGAAGNGREREGSAASEGRRRRSSTRARERKKREAPRGVTRRGRQAEARGARQAV